MKKIIIIFGILFIPLCLGLTVSAEDNSINLCNGSKAAILYESNTDQVLYKKEADLRLPPASMTKIMSLVIIYEAIEEEVITKDTILTISDEATKVEGSKAFLSIGESISVDELLKCICIASANDAAIAMAIHLYGSEAEFVKKMNMKVEELKLKNTHFSDCTGLTSKNHYTTAYDLAVISDYLISHYPDVLNYTNIKEDYIRKDTDSPFWLVNTNKMIGRVDDLDGLKTGYTSFSKYCITLHMNKDNMSLISVVFGYDNPTTRNAESLSLLRYGFSNYKVTKVINKNQIFESLVHALYKNKIDIYSNEDIYYLCKKNEKINPTYEYTYDIDTEFNGQLKVYINGNYISNVKLECSSLEKRNFFEIIAYLFNECMLS